ncbi:histidine phosphatase family protein [Sulfitobacter sp. KE29]|jgi:probable phosphoglycerate mutase|uniref:histidine phosphatase family protein n=1 Tax=Sulfitobacter TaxID=60136 RepID=UPI0007C35FBD|nr:MULTISPECIES: histidine phosphatase family protein [Sulfitobacter]KZY51607.1 phosphoglycerate mutase [Sulfitobacter sp. HI0054]MBO9437177.1 histidine phosphatase family protein [Sulfitobacter sp. R18_2]MDF3418186.1 histidine phosphatase family protein [Sulfitobacter sp. Ks38]MDF3425668.1 histidine phosphatase family protein [Sulfitobacter sp. KE29]MDF3429249.1 histidine phosphatase family protein [Sulfitobacter sp. S46]
MSAHPKIWFLRHGQTEWNRAFRLQGHLDSPLTDQGIAEAERQAQIMPSILAQKPDILVSPLGRAQQTARTALNGAAFQTDARLMEIHAGDWQGATRDEIFAAYPDLAARDPAPLEIYAAAPGGEGLAAFRARIRAVLDSLIAPTVLVAHRLWGQVLRAEVCGVAPAEAGRLSNRQGCVYLLENGSERILEAPA